jgi:hypothetical protein
MREPCPRAWFTFHRKLFAKPPTGGFANSFHPETAISKIE